MKRFLHHRIKSFGFAIRGLNYVFRTQWNAKIHLITMCFTISLGIVCNINSTEWCILILCFALVISLETMNTAVEKTVDLITQEHHPLAKIAKDLAAGAVLFSAICVSIIGIFIFGKYIF